MYDQTIKSDKGKPQLSIVPFDMLPMIAMVREFGIKKYKDINSWKKVEPKRYKDALLRHLIKWLENENEVDEESGLPHYWHFLCNASFLAYFENERIKNKDS